MSNELDALISELKETTKAVPQTQEEQLTEDNLMPFVLKKLQQLINSGLASIETVKSAVQTAVDAEEVSSYADLVKAVSQALDTLLKVGIQNKRSETALKLKELTNENNKSLPKGGTQVFIATREEVVSNFLKDIRAKEEEEAEIPVLELEDKP